MGLTSVGAFSGTQSGGESLGLEAVFAYLKEVAVE